MYLLSVLVDICSVHELGTGRNAHTAMVLIRMYICTLHSVPSSCTPCQSVLIASTSDKKFRFGVPFELRTYILTKFDCILFSVGIVLHTYVRTYVCILHVYTYMCIDVQSHSMYVHF